MMYFIIKSSFKILVRPRFKIYTPIPFLFVPLLYFFTSFTSLSCCLQMMNPEILELFHFQPEPSPTLGVIFSSRSFQS